MQDYTDDDELDCEEFFMRPVRGSLDMPAIQAWLDSQALAARDPMVPDGSTYLLCRSKGLLKETLALQEQPTRDSSRSARRSIDHSCAYIRPQYAMVDPLNRTHVPLTLRFVEWLEQRYEAWYSDTYFYEIDCPLPTMTVRISLHWLSSVKNVPIEGPHGHELLTFEGDGRLRYSQRLAEHHRVIRARIDPSQVASASRTLVNAGLGKEIVPRTPATPGSVHTMLVYQTRRHRHVAHLDPIHGLTIPHYGEVLRWAVTWRDWLRGYPDAGPPPEGLIEIVRTVDSRDIQADAGSGESSESRSS